MVPNDEKTHSINKGTKFKKSGEIWKTMKQSEKPRRNLEKLKKLAKLEILEKLKKDKKW